MQACCKKGLGIIVIGVKLQTQHDNADRLLGLIADFSVAPVYW